MLRSGGLTQAAAGLQDRTDFGFEGVGLQGWKEARCHPYLHEQCLYLQFTAFGIYELKFTQCGWIKAASRLEGLLAGTCFEDFSL